MSLSEDSVEGILAELHGRCLRLICATERKDYEGLGVAARAARRSKIIGNGACKWLERLGTAAAVARHLNTMKAADYVDKLKIVLLRKEGSGMVEFERGAGDSSGSSCELYGNDLRTPGKEPQMFGEAPEFRGRLAVAAAGAAASG